ncbi:transmembrane protein [Achlya hypogyna]|uniref:Transmembrane protein n=1 Tax=Achlya hypogyna TaxID=1202772 RepID=A0A1V9ZR08_ACHHY|nr:transmembrane protein [Achlya hypogyna]
MRTHDFSGAKEEEAVDDAIAHCVHEILATPPGRHQSIITRSQPPPGAVAISIPDEISSKSIFMTSSSRDSSFTATTAMSDGLEYESSKFVFDYAIIFKLGRRTAGGAKVQQLRATHFDHSAVSTVQDAARRLLRSGFHVRLETRWSEKKKAGDSHLKAILLVYAPDAILKTMRRTLEVERWVEGGRYGEHILHLASPTLTAADRLVLVDRLLRTAVEKGGVGLHDFDSAKAFPLHDDDFNRAVLGSWFYEWRDYFRNNDQHIEKIRLHFGEKAGLYFAYMDFYTKWLVPIAVWGVLIYVVSAFAATAYFQLLAITGLFVSGIWGTLFLIFWKRRRAAIRLKWGVGQLEHVNVPNPAFYGTLRLDVPTGVDKLYYPTYKRRLKYAFGYLILLAFIAVETVVTIGFVDLYFFFKSGCAGHCSTTGFENWILVLSQGIMLGIVVDIIQYQIFRVIAVALTNWENHRTEKRYESSRALKIFLWDFFGIYSWFWMCAFVYIPYGQQFSDLLNEYHVLPWPSSYRPGLLVLGNIFVTPLVVTQSLKIVFEKMIPYYLLKGAKKAIGSKGDFDVYHNAIAQDFYNTPPADAKATSPRVADILVSGLKTVSRKLSSSPRKLRASSDLDEAQSPEKSRKAFAGLAVPVTQQKTFLEQRRRFVDRVLEQAHQSPHDNFADYADTCVQFGYVSQFTCIWPFIPLCAVVNNLFEVRSSAFQLAYTSARRVPQRTASIGSWNLFLKFNNIWAIFINIALICYASGLLESFYPACHVALGQIGYGDHLPPLVPNFTCLASADRFQIFLILEVRLPALRGSCAQHTFVMLYAALYLVIPSVPSDVKRVMRKKDKEIKEHFVSQLQLSAPDPPLPAQSAHHLARLQLLTSELKTVLGRVDKALRLRTTL